MTKAPVAAIAAVFSSLFVAGCDLPSFGPKIVTIDGSEHVVCSGLIRVSGAGGGIFAPSTTYRVSFTDAFSGDQVVHGVSKVSISDPPKELYASFPAYLPDTQGADDTGRPFLSGVVYTWKDGAQAKIQNGTWTKVPACSK
jgi:hypothetical protein